MTKFKKGDRVKIIGNHNSRGMEVNDQSDVGKIGNTSEEDRNELRSEQRQSLQKKLGGE